MIFDEKVLWWPAWGSTVTFCVVFSTVGVSLAAEREKPVAFPFPLHLSCIIFAASFVKKEKVFFVRK